MIGLGAYAYRTQSVNDLSSLPLAVGIIVLGTSVTLISCFGCFGAMRENRCFLGMYILILLIIVIAQAGVGITAYVQKGKIDGSLQTAWSNSTDEVRNTIQKEFDCCGWLNSKDHPGSECPSGNPPGCRDTVENYFQERLKIVGIIGLVIASIELLGLLFAFCLMKAINSSEDKERLLKEARNDNNSYHHHGNRN